MVGSIDRQADRQADRQHLHRKPLHTEVFTHRRFYTKQFIYIEVSRHRNFYRDAV